MGGSRAGEGIIANVQSTSVRFMLGTIIRHEWRMLRSDVATWIVFGVLAVVVGYAGWHGRSIVERERSAVEEFEERQAVEVAEARLRAIQMKARLDSGLDLTTLSTQEQVEFANGPLNSVYASRVAAFGIRPPAPLEALSLGDGIDPLALSIGDSSLISDTSAGESTTNPLRLAVGHFDLTFVVLYLYPLAVIALTHNLLTTERETGILPLLLSQPVGPRSFFAGSLIVRALFLSAAQFVWSGLALLSSGLDLTSSDVRVRFVLWFIVTGSYVVFWFALSALVAARGRRAASNALVLCTCWLAGVVVLPGVIQFVVNTSHPAPLRSEYIQSLRSTRALVTTGLSEQGLIDEFFETNPRFRRGPEGAELSRRYTAAVARFDRIAREIQPLRQRTVVQQDAQERLFAVLRFTTPGALVEHLLYDVTGTGPARNRRFVAGIEDVRRDRRTFFWQRQIDLATITAEDYDLMPRYQFQEEPISNVIRRVFLPLAAIAMASGVLVLLAHVRSVSLLKSANASGK